MSAIVAVGRLGGLTWFASGIFLEKPVFLAWSIVCFALVTSPREVWRRLGRLRFEFATLLGLLAWQTAAGGTLNALVLLMYLLGLTCGLLLPDPRQVTRIYWLPWVICIALVTLAYQDESLTRWGLLPAESAFGSNLDEYAIDPRSLAYALLILLFYLSPHFGRPASAAMQQIIMALAALIGSNKFGIAFSLMKNLPRALVAPLLIALVAGLAIVGYAHVEMTAARAALWSDFAANLPHCDRFLGVCTDLILVNNEEGVRSFHSLALDFAWYGGPLGMVAALAFIWRAATVRSLFGRSAGLLFALSLLFGFPPFFNERHVLACYAFLVLFQEGRAARLARRPLREDRAASGRSGGPGVVRVG